MATVYRKTFTKPLPPWAETFIRKGERFARWKDARGRTRTATVTTGRDGSERIRVEAATFTAKYRDGSRIVREVVTGCRDETAARAVLAGLVKRAEHVRSGILTTAQDAVIDHQSTPVGEHVDGYLAHLATKAVHGHRVSEHHRRNVAHNLRRVIAECKFERLAHLDRSAVESWMNRQEAAGMGARTRNTHRAALVAFANWCLETCRLGVNPFGRLPKADESADCRRRRRALTEDELRLLLDVARRRPLLEAMTVRRGSRKGQAAAKVRDETWARLERLGRERALIYKTLVLTGLRKGELASLTAGQLDLDGPKPYLTLRAADEKNRQGSSIPLRHDLAADLREWLADKRTWLRGDPGASHGPLALGLDPATPLFTVPAGLVRILDRDLVLAGIARKVKDPETGKERIDTRDKSGRTIDVHGLRHTFCTHLSKAGVAPRTAQAAARHSTLDLTMNTYTDLKLLDVAGAVEALPDLPLGGGAEKEQHRATGTDGAVGSLAPTLAPTPDFSCKSLSRPDKTSTGAHFSKPARNPARCAKNAGIGGRRLERAKGFEPSTFSLGS